MSFLRNTLKNSAPQLSWRMDFGGRDIRHGHKPLASVRNSGVGNSVVCLPMINEQFETYASDRMT